MNKIFDALEICLHEIENGADIESALARFPNLADELRPILKTAALARSASVPEPSPDAVRRGRARVMQRAAEMRESTVKPRKRAIPMLQRLMISFSLAALLLASSSGLLNASASALPGESLYPVKRGWENVRLVFTLDPAARNALETQFYYERLSEVTDLLAHGRVAPVQFAGIYLQVGGQVYISGIRVIILDSTILPANALRDGMATLVTGNTTADGTVEADSIVLLTDPSTVPVGVPIPTPTPTPISPKPVDQFNGRPTPTPAAEEPDVNSNTNETPGVNVNSNDGKNNKNTNDDDDDNDDDANNKNSNDDDNDDNSNDNDNDNDDDDDDNDNDNDDNDNNDD